MDRRILPLYLAGIGGIVVFFLLLVGSYSFAQSSGSSWVNYTWTFSDGTASSYILDRTDQTYLDHIANADAQCDSVSVNDFCWMPDAGNDQNWQEFGIPECPCTSSTPSSSSSSSGSSGSSGTSSTSGSGTSGSGTSGTSGSGSSSSGTSSNWVNHDWYFTDGSTSSYILSRTDQEYIDYIASIEVQCTQVSMSAFMWMPDAGNDQNWQEFGIPDCSGTASSSSSSNFDVDYNATYPRSGDFGVQPGSSVYIKFTQDIDPSLDIPIFFSLTPLSGGDEVSGTFSVYSNGFEFFPSQPLTDGVTYSYFVSQAIWNTNEIPLGYNYTASFTIGSDDIGDSDTAQVMGTVKDVIGFPIADAFVEVHTPDWSMSRGSQTDGSGNYTIFNVTPGTYLLDVYPPSSNSRLLRPPAEEILLFGGQTETRDLTFLDASKTISGTVFFSDGSLVNNASVSAFNAGSQVWSDTQTDSSGGYTLSVSGGSWEVSVWPSSSQANWSYSGGPRFVSFDDTSSVEAETVNFTVTATDARVTGTVLLPDGSYPEDFSMSVNLRRSDGVEFYDSVESAGSFDIPLVAGTYTLSVYSEGDSYDTQDVSVSVATGDILSVGTIQLIERSDHIVGTVVDQRGVGLEGVEVSAWVPARSGYAYARTDSSGFFDMLVVPGEWEVTVYPDPSLNVYNSEPSRRITVLPGKTQEINFSLINTDSGISGTLVDTQGNVLVDVYGWAELQQDFSGFDYQPGVGGPIDRGAFFFNAPVGTYELSIHLSPGSPYTARGVNTVTLSSGEVLVTKVVVAENNSRITGVLKDLSGIVVTGIDARVFATSGSGGWQEAFYDRATGVYTLNVSSGTWFLGYDIDPATGYLSFHEPNIRVDVGDGETVTQNLIVTPVDAVVTGRVVDPEGNGVPHVFVGVGMTSFGRIVDEFENDFKDPMISGDDTDSGGWYRISIPAGSYFIKTYVNSVFDYVNSQEQQFTILPGETQTIDFSLRSSDSRISGTVLLDDEPVSGAFVWGWSETGGYQETFSKQDGRYELTTTASDIWTVAGAYEHEETFYKSNEIAVTISEGQESHDINLVSIERIAATVVKTSDATKSTAIESEDGATVVAPANSVATGGSVSISITPDTRVPSQGEVKVVGVAYELEARDGAGQEVNSFNSEVTITLPYDDIDIENLGTTEENLVMSFWDETKGVWITLNNSVVNTQDNTVTASVSHFTRFAIVSAADIVPPDGPTNVSADLLNGVVTLSWSDPGEDFAHAKIYRSDIRGKLGSMIITDVSDSTYSDSQLDETGTYYYTIRAIDPAGNESSNTDQVVVTFSAVDSNDSSDGELTEISLTPSSLAEKLAGRILLQVEQNGEAWYVDPDSFERYFLGRPADAFGVMRSRGLGISNVDISRVSIGIEKLSGSDTDGDGLSDLFEDAVGTDVEDSDSDSDGTNDYNEVVAYRNPLGYGNLSVSRSLVARLSGKILLQVEQNGEAWYVSPDDDKRYFLGRPADAFEVMRALGLGISDDNLSQIFIATDSAPAP